MIEMNGRKALLLGCGFLLVIGFVCAVHAQVITGTISGRVSDERGAVVPGATVQAIEADTNVVRTTETNAAGEYVFPFLPPGPYRVVIQKTGFQQIIKSGLSLQIQQTIAQDFVLAVGSVSQSVQVTGETPVMQTESASVGQVIGNKTVLTLPLNGRDYTQLVTLAAGAVQNSNSRVSNGFTLNGGQTFQTEILLNGLENVNRILGTGSTGTIDAITPSVDAIQEFSVQTGDYSAEYGHSAGGVVSVVIKSGTNQFHGDAFDFLRNDKLDANDYFAKKSGLVRPPLRRNQFGGTLGGP
ncbi:MAG: carboxypeptidase regulatory-like domain-containing protein, partial [Candidatus Acidiferrales bacterium]